MTARSFSAAPTNASDAAFRLWGKGISDSFAVAWVQTADTGQVNWTTVTAPVAINTAQGYEIWRMADSLQATAPVFVKIEYGSAGAVNTPAIWLTIGTGSNGSGMITGILFPRTQMYNGGSSATAYTSYGSVAAGRINLAAFATGGTSYCLAFSIERTHGADGVDTGGGVNLLYFHNSSARNSQHLPFAGTIPPLYTAWNTVIPPSGGGAQAPDINVFPVRYWTPGEGFPLHSAVAYVSTDFTQWSTISVTGFDNQSRTYLCVGGVHGTVSYGGTGHLAWRYD